jgi:hypothetical protein
MKRKRGGILSKFADSPLQLEKAMCHFFEFSNARFSMRFEISYAKQNNPAISEHKKSQRSPKGSARKRNKIHISIPSKKNLQRPRPISFSAHETKTDLKVKKLRLHAPGIKDGVAFPHVLSSL